MSGFAFTSRLPALVPAVGAIVAALGAIAAAPTENGMDRPGGVYSYIPTADAAACAIACAQDKICLAWSFKATEFVGCALKAIVPPLSADAQIESGIASRAAEFLALTSFSRPAVPPESKPAPAPEKAKPLAELAPPPEAAFEPVASPDVTPFALASSPSAKIAGDASIVRINLTAAAPIEEEFAGATAESLRQTALLTPAPTMVTQALPALRRVALTAPALIVEEEFLGATPNSFLHTAALTPPPAAPKAVAPPALTKISLTMPEIVFEEEFEASPPLARFTLAVAPSAVKAVAPPALEEIWLMAAPLLHAETEEPAAPPQALAQLTVVPRAIVFEISAERTAAPTQTAALEEDLLGGPDNP